MLSPPATLPLAGSAESHEVLEWAISEYRESFAVVTGFQAEGMVLLDMAARISSAVRVLTLDTGRLPEETYAMIETVRGRYGLTVEAVAPDSGEVERMVTRHGPNLFYEGVPYRALCCHIRKVRPLEAKLRSLNAWAVGLRRAQSEARRALPLMEHLNGRWKLSPLAAWTTEEVEAYTRNHDVPRHALYAKGYTSIGCAPCTRATKQGEAERAGRWWWEEGTDKECGIHFTPSGRTVRTVDVLLAEVLGAPSPVEAQGNQGA